MRKGIILEINDLYLTLLTPEGEFLRTRKLQQEYQVGEEIHFFPELAENKSKKFNLSFLNSFRVRTISLAAIFMLIMTAFIPVYQSGQVYAYMSIDVNPSIELAVDDDLKVLRLKGYNPEGKKVIEELSSWKKKDAALVAELILEKIEEKGFFQADNDVVIATVRNGEAKKAADQKLEKKITEIKQATQEENLEIKVMEATSEDREKAKKQGLSTGVFKEKQIQKVKPSSNPVNAKPAVKPGAIKQKPAAPVKKQQQPKKQLAPGQTKKLNPVPPNANQVKPSKPAVEKNENSGKVDKEKKESGNNKIKLASKGKKQGGSNAGHSGKQNNGSKHNGQKIKKNKPHQNAHPKDNQGKNNKNKHK
jgi:hypothetical protein